MQMPRRICVLFLKFKLKEIHLSFVCKLLFIIEFLIHPAYQSVGFSDMPAIRVYIKQNRINI